MSSSTIASALLAGVVGQQATSYTLQSQPRGVFDQAETESCTSCALAGAMEVLNPDWPQLSPQFHYYVTRHDHHGADGGGSLYLLDSLVVLATEGVCRGELHHPPFSNEGLGTRPKEPAYADGRRRALGWSGLLPRYSPLAQPTRALDARSHLKQRRPVIVAFYLPPNYPNGFLNVKGEWRGPLTAALSNRMHSVLITGFDDSRRAFRIQDSRGENAFQGGKWWMAYDIVDSNVVRQAYVIGI